MSNQADTGMNPRHIDFANALLADPEYNATRAYLTVYKKCSEEAARRNAARLLTRADVHAYVEQRKKERQQRVEAEKGVTQDFVIMSLKEVAERCMQRVPVMRWDRESKCHVQVREEVVDQDTGEVREEGLWQFDSSGANRSLELLGKHLGVFTGGDDGDVPAPTVVNVNVVDGRKP